MSGAAAALGVSRGIPNATADPLARAYATCEALTRSRYENFPVASRLLPAPMRPHVAAVYAFARVADDIADEGRATAVARQARLNAWKGRIHRGARGDIAETTAADRDEQIALAVGHSIRSLDLPLALFDDLLSAFGQDTMTTRYASWDDGFASCGGSGKPVGRLVLRIAGHGDGVRDRSSDALCTALQRTNFWQDFGRDWRAGRRYVPRDELIACGATEEDLEAGRMSAAWGRALAHCVDVTRAKFDEGREVCDGVSGRLRIELRFTWLGGARILERVDRGRLTLLAQRPALGAADMPGLLWRAMSWRATPSRG